MNKEIVIQEWEKNKMSFPCGIGSTMSATDKIREFISDVINKYHIDSISDAACGDFSWMNMVDLDTVRYVGYDINTKMLSENRVKYPAVKFVDFDIINGILPKTDLIICRDCLFHLPTGHILNAINNFKQSESKYLIASTFEWVKENKNLNDIELEREYGFRHINLNITPFDLGDYIDSISEIQFDDRTVGLWNIGGDHADKRCS